jgi:hypothetical protein
VQVLPPLFALKLLQFFVPTVFACIQTDPFNNNSFKIKHFLPLNFKATTYLKKVT